MHCARSQSCFICSNCGTFAKTKCSLFIQCKFSPPPAPPPLALQTALGSLSKPTWAGGSAARYFALPLQSLPQYQLSKVKLAIVCFLTRLRSNNVYGFLLIYSLLLLFQFQSKSLPSDAHFTFNTVHSPETAKRSRFFPPLPWQDLALLIARGRKPTVWSSVIRLYSSNLKQEHTRELQIQLAKWFIIWWN